MSWDQGITVREELPEKFVVWAEDKFFREFGYKKELQYITWFGLDPPIYLDFEDKNGLAINMSD